MQSRPKFTLSIVIAMYNIENYIQYCLDSCVGQEGTHTGDYEVIVINDGSTDHSQGIAEQYANNYDNIRVISQPNGGLSVARNTGIDSANGQYIWFVDGDDAIAPNAICALISTINNHHPDAVLFNFSTFSDQKLIDTSHFQVFPKESGKEIHEKHLRLLPMMAWLTVYRTQFLRENDLKFLPGILHEDKEFSIRAHHALGTFAQIDDSLYHYRITRKESIMANTKKDNTRSLISEIKIIDSLSSFFKNEDTPFARMVLGMCATTFFIRLYDSAYNKNNDTNYLLNKNKRRLYRLMWQSRQWKRRVLLVFIITMPAPLLRRLLPKIGNRSKLM